MKTIILITLLTLGKLSKDSLPVINHVKSHLMHVEGLKLKPYTLRGQKLIGYGHAIRLKEKRLYNQRISKAKAESLLDKDYDKLLRSVDKTYGHLSSTRKQVVVCLLYNMGYIPKPLHHRIKSNADDLQLRKYIKSNGRVVKALLFRRKFEENLWKLG